MPIPNHQWKYVIVQAADGEICGTDDEAAAKEFARNEENWVINMETRQYITAEVDTVEDEDTGEESEETTWEVNNIPEQRTFSF